MFTYEGIYVSFKYGTHKDEHFGERRSAECVVYKVTPPGDEFAVLGNGLALCSQKDNFAKVEGRKIALGRALRDAFPGKKYYEFREAFWKAYLEAYPI